METCNTGICPVKVIARRRVLSYGWARRERTTSGQIVRSENSLYHISFTRFSTRGNNEDMSAPGHGAGTACHGSPPRYKALSHASDRLRADRFRRKLSAPVAEERPWVCVAG